MKRIQELLRTKDVTAEIDKDGELMFIAMCGPVIVRIVVTATESAVIVRAYIPLVVAVPRRQAMFECLALANWQLRFAQFEMDAEDGELRCRADMPIRDAVPTNQQLSRLIYCVWNVTEGYAPALVAAANLRIRNDHGAWAELEPLPNLDGRRGVRIAVFNGASLSIPLQVQLQVPAGQALGRYQGVLTIPAREQ